MCNYLQTRGSLTKEKKHEPCVYVCVGSVLWALSDCFVLFSFWMTDVTAEAGDKTIANNFSLDILYCRCMYIYNGG